MTTPIPTAAADRILAIDLGRHNAVLCDYHAGRSEVAFRPIDATQLELQKQLGKRRPEVVVIEA
jgi:hypothetical protein